jgi:hypothetical protein
MPLLVEKGGMCPIPLQGIARGLNDFWMLVLTAAILRDPRDIETPVPDEKKATFYAAAEFNVRCSFLS